MENANEQKEEQEQIEEKDYEDVEEDSYINCGINEWVRKIGKTSLLSGKSVFDDDDE